MTDAKVERIPGLDGLRALAVIAVVAFHAGQPWADGGYLGVDSFFVLSGFLITRLLLREIARTGGIGLGAFWARRMARLVPALALVVAVVIGIEAIRHADGLSALRADASSALFFVANWRFLFAQHGYFGETASPSPFEHTWSLSIEEQFYLLWPLVMLVLARARRPRMMTGVVAAAGAVASAALMVGLAVTGAGSGRLYFGTDTRVQAILIGAVLATLLVRREPVPEHRRPPTLALRMALHGLAVVGLATTIALWWRLDGSSPTLFRGGATAAAVATAAIIPSVVVLPEGVISRSLGIRPLRALGVISYGVYLWHWPIQLLLTGAATGLRGTPLLALRALLTVGAAAVSYRVVERPLRRRAPRPEVRIVSLASLAVATAGVAVIVAALAAPVEAPVLAAAPVDVAFPVTSPVSSSTTTQPTAATTVTTTVPPTTMPPTTTTTAPPLSPTYRMQVLGDSVAQSVAEGLIPISTPYGLQIRNDGILGCGVAPTGRYRLRGEEHGLAGECESWEATWSARVGSAGAHVAIIQAGRHEVLDRQVNGEWSSIHDAPFATAVASGLDRAIEIAGGTGASVVVLTAPYYRTGERPDGGLWPENDPVRVNRFNQLVNEAAGRHPGTMVVDLGALTNPGGHYASSVDGVPMRRDGVHYSSTACAWFAPWFVPQIRAAAGR